MSAETTVAVMPDADGGWRLFEPRDAPFVYELVTKVDPRWWRFSRHGLEPSQLLEIVKGIAAGVIVFDGSGDSVACAVLAEAGSSGTGMFELYALPNAHAHLFARRFAPELIAAAFAGAPIRRLYHERFENDPVLLGDVAHLFEVEVTYPEFALVEGIYERRTTSVLTAPGFAAWQQAQQ